MTVQKPGTETIYLLQFRRETVKLSQRKGQPSFAEPSATMITERTFIMHSWQESSQEPDIW